MCYCHSQHLYSSQDEKISYRIKDTTQMFYNKRGDIPSFNPQNSHLKSVFESVIDNRTIQLPLQIDTIDMEDIQKNPQIFKQYVSDNIPVIIKNAINHWPALQKWNPQYLQENIKHNISIDLTPDGFADSIKENYFVQPYVKQGTMEEFFSYKDKKNMVAYIQKQCNNFNDEFSNLMQDVDPSFKTFFSEIFKGEPDAFNFWMGEKRSVSSLHKDPYENIYCVIEGEKHFTLIPPIYYPYLQEKEYLNAHWHYQSDLIPTEEKLRWISLNPDSDPCEDIQHKYHVVLKKGDVLYLPSLWYHQVSQYSSEYIVAVNYWWDMAYGSQAHCLYDLLRNLVLNS